jgi:hypothetical protein
MGNPEIERKFDPKWFEPAPNQTQYTQGFYAGRIYERERLLGAVEKLQPYIDEQGVANWFRHAAYVCAIKGGN